MPAVEGLNQKTTLALADLFVILDSTETAGQNAARRVTVGNLDARWRQAVPSAASSNPTNVSSAVAAPGTSTDYARADHVHHFSGSTTGATSFVGLSDTPSSLSGDGGEVIEVNSAGNALAPSPNYISFVKA